MISVLLVDDEPALLEIAQLFLEDTGSFVVSTCPSGRVALEMLSKKQYDVIVSDYEMPGMDGILLLKTLKQNGDRTPVIIFTGNGPEQVVIDALNNGATFYLKKGCDSTAIFAELAHKCRLGVQQRRTEIALKESEEKYRSLVEHAHEAILILDFLGTILLANTAAAKTIETGSSSYLIGRNVMEFITPGSRDAVLKDIARLVQGCDAYVAEYDGVTVPGNPIRVESIGKVISYESKPAILVSICSLPLKKTSGQELRPHDMMFRALTENADHGVFIVQEERIRYANPYLATMTGYSADELQNIPVWDLVHPDYRDNLKVQKHDWQKNGKINPDPVEVIILAKDGVEYRAQVGITSFEFDEKPALLVTARDVTVQREAETRLRQLDKKLHLLNEVTHHDLLNNFTALFGYFEIIRQNTVDADNLEFMKKQELILSAIREQIHFTGYYQNIGNIKPQWQDVKNTIREAAFTLPLDRVRLTFDLGEAEIYADPLLVRVFYNLMENALRHGEHVTEICYRCEKHTEGILIIYEDNGIGIPRTEKERIFVKGIGKNSGLGLFLIKEILESTSITIRETGEPGTGARFELLVPKGMFRPVS
ncbi:MAG: PAS domain S-box protein [Methanoregula sp.]|nr:PAS domain S-box protein [Methanoregula sp.]